MAEENEHLLKNTVAEERRKLRDIVRRLGSRLSGLAFTCGLIVLGFAIFMLFEPQDPVLSSRLGIVFMGSLGFVGGLSILCGSLLLLGED